MTRCTRVAARAVGLALGLSLASAACIAQTKGKVLPRDPELRTGQVEATQETMAQAVALAVRVDAARRLKRDDNGKHLTVRTDAVTWRDGAVGCPASDRMYSQGAVPGWRISVGDEKRVLTYHATQGGRWLLCPRERVQAPLPGEALR